MTKPADYASRLITAETEQDLRFLLNFWYQSTVRMFTRANSAWPICWQRRLSTDSQLNVDKLLWICNGNLIKFVPNKLLTFCHLGLLENVTLNELYNSWIKYIVYVIPYKVCV